MTDFGSIITPDEVGKALELVIRTWHRTAFDAAAEGRGFSRRLPKIASYRHVNERPEKWDEDALPCCVIVIEEADVTNEGDSYDAIFPAAVAIVHGANGQEATNKIVRVMGSAIVSLLLHKPGLDGVGEIADWSGFVTSEIPPEQGRTLAMSASEFAVHVPNVVTLGEWPAQPLPDPDPDIPPTYPDTPTAEDINVTVTQLAQEG